MKIHRIIATIVALMILTVPAMASGLTAKWSGNAIEARWQTATGDCELTIYQNDWPVWTGKVSGGSGSVSIPMHDTEGRFALRLKAPEGCYTAAIDGIVHEAPEPTEAPVVVAEPTTQPTVKPTEAPTPRPTAVPTARPTAKPTLKPVSVNNRDDLATQVLNLVNEERAARGLGSVRMDSELTRAACVRAGEIVQSFSHTRPDGTAWSTVSRSAYGENIARGQKTAEKVMAAWMTSTNHRENILRGSYGSIGICAYSYNGVMYWVQLFGK